MTAQLSEVPESKLENPHGFREVTLSRAEAISALVALGDHRPHATELSAEVVSDRYEAWLSGLRAIDLQRLYRRRYQPVHPSLDPEICEFVRVVDDTPALVVVQHDAQEAMV